MIRETLQHLTKTGFTANLVTGVIFLLVSPGLMVFLGGKKGIIIGAAAGLTVFIWVVAIHMIQVIGPDERSESDKALEHSREKEMAHQTGQVQTQASISQESLKKTESPGAGEKLQVQDIKEKPAAHGSQENSIEINAPIQGPVIISQNQKGGQVAETINNYGPPKRSLSPDQISRMLDILRPFQGQCIAFASTQGDLEAHEFKETLLKIFTDAGWRVSDNKTFMFFDEKRGLVITIPFGSPENDAVAQALGEALIITGNPVSGNHGDMAKDCGFYIQVWHAPE